jgi:hypothetical protein
MSFARFLAWLVALAVTGGVSLIAVRYGWNEPDWGTDAFWSAAGAVLFTRTVHNALVEMWSRQ